MLDLAALYCKSPSSYDRNSMIITLGVMKSTVCFFSRIQHSLKFLVTGFVFRIVDRDVIAVVALLARGT